MDLREDFEARESDGLYEEQLFAYWQGDAEFGVIAAQEIIDIVAEHLGPEIYNRAIEDAKKEIQKKLEDLEIDLDLLKS